MTATVNNILPKPPKGYHWWRGDTSNINGMGNDAQYSLEQGLWLDEGDDPEEDNAFIHFVRDPETKLVKAIMEYEGGQVELGSWPTLRAALPAALAVFKLGLFDEPT